MGYRVNSPGDPDADVLGGKGAALGLASPPPPTLLSLVLEPQ